MAKPVTIRILGDASGLTKALGVAESGLGKLGGAVAGVGKVAGAAIVGAGVVAAGGFVKGFSDAMDREALRAVVGDDVLGVAADVYRNAWGGSLEEVSMMVADAQRTFGEDADLTYITEGAYAISQKLGLDTQEILNTAGVAIADFGGDGAQVMDLFAAKLGGMSQMAAEEALAATQEYGTVFDGLGFSLSNTLGVMGSFGEKGTIGVDKVSDAFKELTIRGSDMSEGTGKAYAALGLDQEKLTRMLLAGGEDAFSAMQMISSGLEGMEDPIAQSQHALALFGAPLEDLGATQIPEFFETLNAGMGTWEDTRGAAGALGEELGDNLKTKLEGLKRQGLDKLAEVVEKRVLPAVSKLTDYVIENFPKWREAIMPVIDAVIEGVRMFADVLKGGEGDDSFISKYAEYLRDIVWPLIVDVKDWIVDNWPTISAVFSAVFGFIVEEVLPRVIEAIRFVAEVIGVVVGYIVEHWPEISAVIQTVIDFVVDEVLPRIVSAFEWIQEAVQVFIDAFQRFWAAWGDTITESLTKAWDAIKGIVSGALDYLKGVFDFWKELFTGDWGAMWDAIVDQVSGLWTLLKGAFLLGWEAVKLSFKMVWESIKIMATAAFGKIVDGIKALPGLMLDGLKAGGQLLLDAGSWMGDKIMEGLVAALKFVGQTLWDMLPGPVQWGLEHGASAVGGVLDFFNPFGGGDDGGDPEYTMDDFANPDSPAYTMMGGGGYDYRPQARGGGTNNITVNTSTNATPSEITDAVVWGLQVSGVN